MKKVVLCGAIFLGMNHASWAMQDSMQEDCDGWILVENQDEVKITIDSSILPVEVAHTQKLSPKIITDAISEIPQKKSPSILLNKINVQNEKNYEIDMPSLEDGEDENIAQIVDANEQSVSNLNVWVVQCVQWALSDSAQKDVREENNEDAASTFAALMAFSDWTSHMDN